MDSSPVALFDSYDQDFQQIIQSVREKLNGEANDQHAGMLVVLPLHQGLDSSLCTRPEQRKATIRRVEMELDEADEMVRCYLSEFSACHRMFITVPGVANGD